MAGLEHITWLLTLVSFFGVLSVLATAMVDWWARWRGWRQASLRQAVGRLLRSPAEQASGQTGSAWGEAVLAHPRVSVGGQQPDSLAPEVFAEVTWQVLAEAPQTQDMRQAPVWQVLTLGEPEAQGQSSAPMMALPDDQRQRQQARLAGWFSQAMQLETQRYRARTRRFLFGLGFVLSMVANVNALRVAEGLQADPASAQALEAQLGSEAMTALARQQAESAALMGDGLASGPAGPSAAPAADALQALAVLVPQRQLWGWRQGLPEGWRMWLWQVMGCLLTALAVAQGAEFWFDLLKRMTSLKGRAGA